MGRRLASFLIPVVSTTLDYRSTRVAKGDAPSQPPAESGEAAAPPAPRLQPADASDYCKAERIWAGGADEDMAGCECEWLLTRFRDGRSQSQRGEARRREDQPGVVFVSLGFSSFFCFPAREGAAAS